MLRVDDFNIVRHLDVCSSHSAFAVFAQAQSNFIAVVHFEHNAFEVQQDVDHIFLHAIDRRVLVHNASDGDFSHCIANHRRQQNATQSIAQRVAIATLKRLQGNLGAVVTQLLDVNIFWFQQVCLHSDFLQYPRFVTPVRLGVWTTLRERAAWGALG